MFQQMVKNMFSKISLLNYDVNLFIDLKIICLFVDDVNYEAHSIKSLYN
jgi:hypothetical protein